MLILGRAGQPRTGQKSQGQGRAAKDRAGQPRTGQDNQGQGRTARCWTHLSWPHCCAHQPMQIHVLHGAPPALGTQPGQERGTLSDCSTSFRNSSAPAKGWDGPGPCVTSLDALLGSSALHFQGLRPAWLWWHRCHISSSTHLLPTHQIQGRDPAHATADSRKVTPLSMYETHSTFLQHLFC